MPDVVICMPRKAASVHCTRLYYSTYVVNRSPTVGFIYHISDRGGAGRRSLYCRIHMYWTPSWPGADLNAPGMNSTRICLCAAFHRELLCIDARKLLCQSVDGVVRIPRFRGVIDERRGASCRDIFGTVAWKEAVCSLSSLLLSPDFSHADCSLYSTQAASILHTHTPLGSRKHMLAEIECSIAGLKLKL